MKRPLEIRRAALNGKRDPLASSIKMRSADGETIGKRQLNPYRVLILDDEPSVTKSLSILLSSVGHTGVECQLPTEARTRLKAEKFDLLISDYRMPEMTGLELISALRNDRCVIPVLLVTAYSPSLDLTALSRLGVFSVLKKPFDLNTFQKALSMFSNSRKEVDIHKSHVSPVHPYLPGDKIILQATGEIFTVHVNMSDRFEPGIFVKELIGRPLLQREVRPADKTRSWS